MTVINLIERKLELLVENIPISLFLICLSSLLIRLIFFPFGIPLTLDSLLFFKYAIDLLIFGSFPPGYDFPNNGWPLFLSAFFALYPTGNFIDFVTIQRLLTVSISVFTIIPVYLLCTRFTTKPFALFGASLFAFASQSIENSLYGLSEPAYVMLTCLSLFFSQSSNKKLIYVAFSIAGLATIIRYEGAMVFFLLSVMFFVQYKSNPKGLIIRYLLCVGIFILILLPISYLRLEATGYDGVFSSVVAGTNAYGIEAAQSQDRSTTGALSYAANGIISLFKFGGILTIPVFVLFVPLGIFFLFKNKQSRFAIIASVVLLSLPALYAYSRGILEIRYLLVILPWFSVLAAYSLRIWIDILKKKYLVIFLMMIVVVVASVVFLDRNLDLSHENEAAMIAEYIVEHATGVNQYYPESRYIHSTIVQKNWNDVKLYLQHKIVNKHGVDEIIRGFPVIPMDDFTSIEDYIKKSRDKGLSHIVIDDKKNRVTILRDVFIHPENYSYLTKVYDSKDLGFEYNVKVYKIDYSKFG